MSTPPILAQKLLKTFAGKANLEDIQGDLDEVYGLHLEQSGKLKADVNYWKQIFSLLFSYGLRKRKSKAAYSPFYHKNSIAMLSNYFKIALRNFSKHKLFTSLNIVGLSLGMCVCLLALSVSVGIYQSDEWQANKERIFQINTALADESGEISYGTYGSTFHAVGNHLHKNYPFIERIVNIKSGFVPEINHHGNLMDFHGYYVDNSFLETFSFKLLEGDAGSALESPFSIVLTSDAAKTLYRDDNPLGKTLETQFGTFTVTGIIENPRQTHFFFEILTSYETFRKLNQTNLDNDWINYRNNYVYALLSEGVQKSELSNALSQIGTHAESFHTDMRIILESIRLDEAVPRWNISNAIGIGWDQPTMIFFMVIGLLVLLPAVFNYTNLSIAQALKRAKEIGVRKVVGAEKAQIKAQFIVETVLLSVLGLLGSLVILYPMKTEFMGMVRAAEVISTDPSLSQVVAFLLFAIIVGILGGIFPAQYFARLNPIQTLKGEIKNGKSTVSGYKKGLFVFQFFLSLIFVIGVVTIARQHAYALNTNHGFDSDNVLAIPFEGLDKQVAMHELKNHGDVKALTTASHLPGVFVEDAVKATSNRQDTIDVKEVFIGDGFIEKMNIQLAWGNSDALHQSNQNEEFVLVNEQFIQSMKVFNLQKDTLLFSLEDGTQCRIVGILQDFNFEPLTEIIDPMMFRYSIEKSRYALLTVNSTNIKRTINELEMRWREIDQESHFEATFLDHAIEDAYYFLRVQIKFFTVLSTLAITISCLGLLGMVSYTTENRTKEIAIRKIMGATDGSLYYLLTKDFIRLILIAALIATPVAYVFYDKLFLYFLIRYGTGLGWVEVIVSIAFLFLVGLSSIYWQTSRVTKANPATKLRYE